MFRNEFKITQSNLVSKKEKKDILKRLPLSYNKKVIEYIQKNFDDFTFHKSNLNKKRILTYQNIPILFEIDIDVFCPTIYLLNMFPDFLNEKTCLIYDETDSYLDNGADLMLKGVINKQQIKEKTSFRLNDLFTVQTVSGVVTSIGQTLASNITLNIDQPSGKFLKIIHRLNDSLWNFGTKKIPTPIVYDTTTTENTNLTSNDINSQINIENTENNSNIEGNLNEENKVINDKINIDISNNIENIDINSGKIEANEENLEDINDEREADSITKEEMDKNIDEIFMTSIKVAIKDEQLPLDPGKLLKEIMKPIAKQLNLLFDFKNSNYKKINSYLQQLTKDKNKNIIQFQKPKGLQNEFLTNINRTSSEYINFKPKIKRLITEKIEKPIVNDNVILNQNEQITISQMFKPNQQARTIFNQTDPEFKQDQYYDSKYILDIFQKYLKAKNLFLEKGMISVDETLSKILFSKNETKKMQIEFTEAIDRFKHDFVEKDFITKSTTDQESNQSEIIATTKGNETLKIKIFAKKLNNKNVTIVDGLEKFVDLNHVQKLFAKHFACAVSIRDFSTTGKDAIFIQGYWVHDLTEMMQKEFKLNKNFIVIEDKLKLKKK